MTEQDHEADRSDMVAYMSEANDRGEWHRPSLHPIGGPTFRAIRVHRETDRLFALRLDTARVEAWRVAGTNDAIGNRRETQQDRAHYRIAFFGEMCMDLRYWLLQAEINDVPLEIMHTNPEAVDLIVGTSPPEWSDKILELLDKYRVGD